MTSSTLPKVRTRFRTAVTVVLCAAVSTMIGCNKSISDKDIRPISLAEVRALTTSDRPSAALLIDPRSPAAFAQGHLPGARNIRLDTVSEDGGVDPALQRYGNLVVYGEDPGSGVATAMTKRLMTIGYKDVRLFLGGVSEWRRAGLDLVTSGEAAGSGAAGLPAAR